MLGSKKYVGAVLFFLTYFLTAIEKSKQNSVSFSFLFFTFYNSILNIVTVLFERYLILVPRAARPS